MFFFIQLVPPFPFNTLNVTLCFSIHIRFNKIAFQSKVDHPQTGTQTDTLVTLTLTRWPWYELDLDILPTKINFLSQGLNAFKS